jgi:hypothetical protein
MFNLPASLKVPGRSRWAPGRAARAGLLAALAGAVQAQLKPNTKRPTAKILPVDTRAAGALGQLATAAAALGLGVPGQDGSDANFVDILNSRWTQERLLNAEYTFRIRPRLFGPGEVRRQTLYSYLGAKTIDQALMRMGGIISASRDLKSKVIAVTAETRSPDLSQQLVSNAVQSLETFVLQKNRTRGGEKARFAEVRLKDAQRELTGAEDAFGQFLEGNRGYQTSANPTVRLKGLRLEADFKLRLQLVSALALNLEQAMMEEKNDVPIVNVLDPANLASDRNKPHRSSLVLGAFAAGTLLAWAWSNRMWIRDHVLEPTA